MSTPLVAILGKRAAASENARTPVVIAGRLYVDAVQRAGAVPVVVPPGSGTDATMEAVSRCDALILLGGGDVDPRAYGHTENARLYGVDPAQDSFEIEAVRRAVEADIPVLAVCRGHQVLNVALGGTLIQHLPSTADHRDTMHTVSVVPGSRVASAMGTHEPLVHSFHHQAIDSLAPGLTVVATAADGTIEAVEHASAGWVVGVQWHPEDTAAEDAPNQGLFDALVAAARR
ncbi:MAG: gamma-glutamyl-gamma-aminobutyrate hydrolase family protein [Ilumatobacteraceae bacterium]